MLAKGQRTDGKRPGKCWRISKWEWGVWTMLSRNVLRGKAAGINQITVEKRAELLLLRMKDTSSRKKR